MRTRLMVSLLLWIAPALSQAADVKLAERTTFTIPLADGQHGTALLLDARQMLVAAPGNPPRLALFAIQPNDQPSPGPSPEPSPPGPSPSGPLDLLWIEETQARTPGQAKALTDRAIREGLAAAGWTLRVVDQDVTDENGKTPPDLAPAIEQAKAAGLPYLIVKNRNGAEIFAGKAPDDGIAFTALLKKLGLNTLNTTTNATTDQPMTAPPQACPSGRCPTGSINGTSAVSDGTTRVYSFRRR